MKLSDKIIYVVFIILFITFFFLKIFSNKSEKILLDYSSFKATNTISLIINNSINEVLLKNKTDNIIKESKDNFGNIINIDFDNLIVNRILYLITNNILNDTFINSDNEVYYIPLGVIYDIPILNNLGPLIPYKVEVIKNVGNEAKINIKEYGINSSLIELVISVNIQSKVIMPFKSKKINVKKSIILDSKIVQGKVPDYYGGIISSSLK